MDHSLHLEGSDRSHDILVDDMLVSSMGVATDNYESCKLLVASWLMLLADSPLRTNRKPIRTYLAFVKLMKVHGLKKVVLGFSDIAHQLVANCHLSGTESLCGPWIGDWFEDTPVFYEYNRWYHTGDVEILDWLYTFLNFGKKSEYMDPVFDESAFRAWLDVEERLAIHEYDPYDVQNMHIILDTVLPTFSVKDFRPKFGPGSVAERGVRGRYDKISTMSYSPLVDRFLFKGAMSNYGTFAESGLSPARVIPRPERWSEAGQISSRKSLLRFVPKNMKTARSICMEPNVLMFIQQGVLREMLRLLKTSSLSKFIDIEDQARNQTLSEFGSYTMAIDTIDLSAASDSVGLQLVRNIFPSSWLLPMLVTRSTHAVGPDGVEYPLRKFAPMGSALCFPTQCIIFASVCIYAGCLYLIETYPSVYGESIDSQLVSHVVDLFGDDVRLYAEAGFQPLAVYGDDICVDSRLTPYVTSILSRLGFAVNTAKSFTGSQAFRESCGKFYLAGSDITPLYFKVKGVRRARLTAQHVASLVHVSNAALDKGYLHLRRFLMRSIRGYGKSYIPYVEDPDAVFGFKVLGVPNNRHLKGRRSIRYQRSERKVCTITYETRRFDPNLPGLDAYEYMRWWARPPRDVTSADSQAASRADTDGARLQWRWIPLN